MKSMTGYGRSKPSSPTRSSGSSFRGNRSLAESWARSVNGRFLEIRVHVPREWAELEPEIRSMAQEALARGTVDIHVNRVRGLANEAHIEIDDRLAKKWAMALRKLAKEAGFDASSVPFELVAKAPDVVRVVNEDTLSGADKALILNVVSDSLSALQREKEREGKVIQLELLDLLTELERVVDRVEELAKAAPDDLQARFKNRMERLESTGIKGPMSDDSRFHQEVALLIDRGDIREEITRLKAHLRVYRDLVKNDSAKVPAKDKRKTKVSSGETKNESKKGTKKDEASDQGAIGKTLDFYAQELLREVNTVGSKSQTAELTRIVVEAKTLVEKIREQVQNVE